MNRRKAATLEQYLSMRRKRNALRISSIVLSVAILVSIGCTLPKKNDISEAEPAESDPPVAVVEQAETPVVHPVVEAPAEEVIEVVVEEEIPRFTDEEIDLIALVAMAEAEGECELGKRLVIDTVLNRVNSPRFPDTVHGVIYQKHQFTSMWNGRVDRCYVRDDIRQLVLEEIEEQVNYECVYFRMDYYHSFGTPLFQVESHYFSGC